MDAEMSRPRAPLAQYLAEMLPSSESGPLTLGLVDWQDTPPGLPGNPPSAADAPCDTVVWNATGSPNPVSRVADLRQRLSGSGLLLAAVALPAATGRRATREEGALPTSDQAFLRRLVLAISEGGFAILEDREVTSDTGAWQLIKARLDPFEFRAYREGDEDAILALFPLCFHVQRGIDHWRWKYVDNPWGRHHISLSFSPRGDLSTHYAGYPVPFRYTDRKGKVRSFPALQMGDTMNNPDYRHIGRARSSLLARTVRHFFALYRGGPFGFFYGFNTGGIQRFCRWFIGGTQVEPVGFWTRSLEGAADYWPKVRGYSIERVERVDSGWDRFFERVAPEYGFLVERNARYVDWRYLQCPDAEYVVLSAKRWGRLVGWGVFRRKEDRIIWGDALFSPRHTEAATEILRSALGQPELRGAKTMDAWFSRGPLWWVEPLVDLGFNNEPEPNRLSFMALPEGEPEAAERLGELYYTMGDGDLF